MYIKVENDKLQIWSPIEFESSVYTDIDYNYFEEHIDNFKIIDGVLTDVSNTEGYRTQQALKREKEFKKNFIQTSLGWYRQVPKGYANALQSIHSIDKMVLASNGLTIDIANVVIFYPKPDFTKPEECTEKWLLANQYNPDTMTKEQWATFSAQFELLWAQEMYRQDASNNDV